MENSEIPVIEIPVVGTYRFPMSVESLAEDEAHMAENRRRREAGEELLPPLPAIPYETNRRYYVVDRNSQKV